MIEEQEGLFGKILTLAMTGKLALWAGAGLSMEAGYPSANKLASILWEKLSEEDKIALQPKSIHICETDLTKISDYYVNNNNLGKRRLISILNEIFNVEPNESESHEIIKKLAFFKTIITTNYDLVFEKTIPNLQKIRNAKDLARSKSNSRKLIKIHGDLINPKTMVLTERDYSNLYSKDNLDPFWSKINVELSEKAVLFIGYGLNDGNVKDYIEQIQKKLKKLALPKYLVAPGLSGAERLKLQSYKIQYFDSTGLEFLRRLYAFWKNEGYKCFGNDEVLIDDLMETFKNEGISLSVSSIVEKGRLLSFNTHPGEEKVFDLSFQFQNKVLMQNIVDWQKGIGPDILDIPKDAVQHMHLKLGDIVIGDKATLPEYKLIRRGIEFHNIRIYFDKSELELTGLYVRSHRYNYNGFKLLIKNANAQLEILIPEIKKSEFSLKLDFKLLEPINSISEVLQWQEAMLALGKGEPFIIFSEKFPNGFKYENGFISDNPNVILKNKLIFQVLNQLEKKFKVRFTNLKEKDIYAEEVLKNLQFFHNLFTLKKFDSEILNGLPLKYLGSKHEKQLMDLLDEAERVKGYLIIEEIQEPLEFLSRKLDLGKKQIVIENPVLSKSLNESAYNYIKSKNNNYFIFHEAFGLLTLKNKI